MDHNQNVNNEFSLISIHYVKICNPLKFTNLEIAHQKVFKDFSEGLNLRFGKLQETKKNVCLVGHFRGRAKSGKLQISTNTQMGWESIPTAKLIGSKRFEPA